MSGRKAKAKPIKGTGPWFLEDAARDGTSRADLLTADLLRVCVEATTLSKFARLDAFATVHQLVTTAEGDFVRYMTEEMVYFSHL
mmetsp:Transcript_17553/g.56965  ORF Transcript_17553/g.56965 Transcript_17553/m.56965 type:complete len:85 (+) Transcript_17553:485-739(+)